LANSSDYIAHVLELARPTAGMTARPMFGGHGLYVDGVIVAIVIDDIVYFKTDTANRGEFAALSLEPFVYVTKRGERTLTSYHRAPDEALESPAAMGKWLRSALGAALRSAASKLARRKPRTTATSKKRPKPR
jgi:DNA transformation protein